MVKRITAYLVGLAIVLLCPASFAAEPDYSDAAIRSFVRENFDFMNADLGVVVGLIDDQGGRVIGIGKTDATAGGRELNGDTLFEIGSVSKTFTTLLLQDMVERGEMKLDDPVAKYLPDSVKMPTHGGKEITLLHLATHTSGLPFNPDNFFDPTTKTYFDGYTADRLYACLSGTRLNRDPGAQYAYSNLGMGLLGHAISRKAGADYESLLVERICAPLGMDSTRITLSPQLKMRLPPGHDASAKPTANFDDLGCLVGAGAIRSCANDLLKYVAANAGLKPSPLTPIMAKTHVIRHHDSEGFTGALQGETAMAWMDEAQSRAFGSPLLGHAGGTGGYSAFIGFDKAHRRGVVVLVNQFGAKQRPAFLGWMLLQRLPLTADSINRVSVRVANIVGIGVALDVDKSAHTVFIRTVYPDTPAARAGLAAGQVFQKIGDTAVAGMTMEQCAALIKGPAGTKVRLELIDKTQKVAVVELTRAKIQ
jgi:CubicO group peptidase (beta-lactamase class C family)